jgi:hydrogenase maturation factor
MATEEPRYPVDFDLKSEVDRMMLAMSFLESLDLDSVLRAVGDAHLVGWFLDPTRYRDAMQRGDMDAMAEMARALVPAVEVYREKIKPKVRV